MRAPCAVADGKYDTSTDRFAPAGHAKLHRPLPSQSEPVLRRVGRIPIPSFSAPSTNLFVERDRIHGGTSRTRMRRSTSSYAGSSARSDSSSSPSSRTHRWCTSPGIRKHTPPVSSDDPPTARPTVSEMTGVSPTPNAVSSPASRNSRRTDSLGVHVWYSSGRTYGPSSSTTTLCPASARSAAATAPPAPEPTIATSQLTSNPRGSCRPITMGSLDAMSVLMP